MKILHLNLQKNWRGGEQQLGYLIKGLTALGQEQLLLCRKRTALEEYAICNEIPYVSIEYGLLQKPKAIHILHKLIFDKGISIVHCHESKGHGLVILTKIILGLEAKIVLHRRVMFPISGLWSKKVKYASRYINKTICISHAVEGVFQSSTQNLNTTVIPDMVDLIFPYINQHLLTSKWGIKASKVVGYIAALTFEKDHISFLNTAKKLTDVNSEIHFVLIGSGKLEASLKSYAQELGLSKRVHFLGFLENAKEIIPEIDVLLFTSTHEGLGSTILDFFVAKKPVVTVENGGSEDLVFDGITGFICKPKDVNCLAEHIEVLLRDTELTQKITNQAASFARENFSIPVVCERILAVYHSL